MLNSLEKGFFQLQRTYSSFLKKRGIHYEDAHRQNWKIRTGNLSHTEPALRRVSCLISASFSHCSLSQSPLATCWFSLLALFWITSLNLIAFCLHPIVTFSTCWDSAFILPASWLLPHGFFLYILPVVVFLIIASFFQNSLMQIPKKESNYQLDFSL